MGPHDSPGRPLQAPRSDLSQGRVVGTGRTEIRAGKPTTQALRGLADRTGVAELSAFAAMLIQTERFGTSVADALRVHADGMRSQRLLRAEEAAAKAPLKMLFPTVMFIFPAILMVTLGPGLMRMISMFKEGS